MKRIVYLLLGVVLLLSALVVSIPFLLSSDIVRAGLLSNLKELTGRNVTFRGNPTISFQPFLGIEISELVVSGLPDASDQTPLLKVETVNAQLDILPALLGNVEITQYQLVRPELDLRIYQHGKANWEFEKGSLREVFAPETEANNNSTRAEKLGNFQIVDGQVHYENMIDGTVQEFTDIDGTFIWPDTSSDTDLALSLVWNGEAVSFQASIDETAKLFAGSESQLSVELASSPLNFSFEGTANQLSNFFVAGDLSAQSPSLMRLSELAGIDLDGLGALGEWQASGSIEATMDGIKLTQATINVAGNEATGVLQLSKNELGQSRLDGTLAFDQINATSYLQGWSAGTTTTDATPDDGGLILDLRISAKTVETGPVTLEDVAATINGDHHNWIFDIGESSAFGGQLIAKFGSRQEEEKQFKFLELRASDVTLSEITNMMDEQFIKVTGKTNITASLKTDAFEEGLALSGLDGSVEAEIQSGQIVGINLPKLLNSFNTTRREITDQDATPFESFNLKLFLSNGTAALTRSIITTNETSIQLIGDADLVRGGLAIRAQKLTEQGLGPDRLFIGGTMANPLISLREGPKPQVQTDQQETDNGISN